MTRDDAGRLRLRALVVDDERLAREGLARTLASDPDLEVIQSASAEACALLREEDFDLLFLDIGEHAVKAFAVSAFDHLVKPIADDRLNEAVRRGKEAVRLRRREVPRFLVRSGRSTYSVEVSAIDWIESADNYSRLWTADRSHLVRESMQTIEQQLAGHGFVRAHRTAIVNLRRVTEVRTTRGGRYFAVLEGERHVPVSRDRRAALLDAVRKGTAANG